MNNHPMVEIFKTDVWDQWDAEQLIMLLNEHFPDYKINFDLDDCDKILRIEGEKIFCEKIVLMVNEKGYLCEILQ